jgi:hypothetical protein
MADAVDAPDTSSAAIELLAGRGYDRQFDVAVHARDSAECCVVAGRLRFVVEERFRFEGASDPDDEEVVAGVRCSVCGRRGIVVSAFGPDADDDLIALAEFVSGRADDLPPAIEPDTKNWTWVLEEACPDCGFDARSVRREDVGERTRAVAAELAGLLGTGGDAARRRPDPAQWSATEYGCHVRDVFVLFHERLDRMLTEDAPAFANWDQDVTAVERRYDLADPAEVARELVATGAVIADRFDAVAGDQWERTGTRSDGATFTVESFARYFLHDPVHHVHDVRSGFERLSAR